jgi:predicted PurR-regulated permease PerM
MECRGTGGYRMIAITSVVFIMFAILVGIIVSLVSKNCKFKKRLQKRIDIQDDWIIHTIEKLKTVKESEKKNYEKSLLIFETQIHTLNEVMGDFDWIHNRQ